MKEIKVWFSRIIRSKTINTAHLIVLMGAIQANSEFFSRWLTPADLGTFISGIGIVMYILRAKTTMALTDK